MKKIYFLLVLIITVFTAQAQTEVVVTGLGDPEGILIDGNIMYIAESGPASQISKVDLSGTLPLTTESILTGLGGPSSMVLIGNDLYYTELSNNRVAKINVTDINPVPTTVTEGVLSPYGLEINGNDLYISELGAARISKIDITDNLPTSNVTVVVDELSFPSGLLIIGNELFFTEAGIGVVTKINLNDDYPAPTTAVALPQLNTPRSLLAVGSDLLITDEAQHRVAMLDLDEVLPGVPTTYFAPLQNPIGIAQDNQYLYVAEQGSNQIIRRPINTLNEAGNYDFFYVGGDGGSWNNENSWEPNGIPNDAANVFIGAGGAATPPFLEIGSITVDGGIALDIAGNIEFESTAISTFKPGSIVDWALGNIYNGTINNYGQLNITNASQKVMYDEAEINNYNEINFDDEDGEILIISGTLHNYPTGVIDLEANNTKIRGEVGQALNNEGTITKTGAGFSEISWLDFTNSGGTITVDNGILRISPSTQFQNMYLVDGTYNVTSSGILQFGEVMFAQGTFTGNLDGPIEIYQCNFYVNDEDVLNLNFTGSSSFSAIGNNSDFRGGGTINNYSRFSVDGAAFGFQGPDTLTFNNYGIVDLNVQTSFVINSCYFNNMEDGLIDLKADNANIQQSGGLSSILNNYGTIRKTEGLETSMIALNFTNYDGTIEVNSGTLNTSYLYGPTRLIEGTYHVDESCALSWTQDTFLEGTLSGNLEGEIQWERDLIVEDGNEATFNFDGSGIINCLGSNPSLQGGGILTNNNVLNLIDGPLSIDSDSPFTLNNAGEMNINEGSIILNNGTINNNESGTLTVNYEGNFIVQSGGPLFQINNSGLIIKSTGIGQSTSNVDYNHTGSLLCETGTIQLTGTFEGNGHIGGGGSLELPSEYEVSGLVTPGNSPGTLNYIGDYSSLATSVLEIELDGQSAGDEYDVLAVEGDADFAGDINIILGFSAAIDDEFIVATTSGVINNNNFPATTYGQFEENTFEFSITQIDDNKIVLKVLDINTSINEFNPNDYSVAIFPNPIKDQATITISSKNYDSKLDLVLINSLGQEMKRYNLKANQESYSILLTEIPSGIYFLQLLTENIMIETKRVVIK